ncbi:MAG: hypothetical protein V4498_09645 [candidate division FCPU426 bacterium]
MKDADCFMYFVAALRQVFGDGAVLYIEGSAIDAEVEALYLSHAYTVAPAVMRIDPRPRTKVFHVLMDAPFHRRLSAMAASKTYAQICDSMLVYRGQDVLMDGSRLGERIVLFSGALPESKIKRFSNTRVHGNYEWVETGKNLV